MRKQLAIDAFGSVIKLARAVGVTRGAVYQWPDPIPEPRASHVRELIRRRRGKRVAAQA